MDATQFNRAAFEAIFQTAIDALTQSERVTRETLRDLSRSVIEAVHITGDIAFVNKLIMVLSPMNKRTAVLFFKTFTGFRYDDAAVVFLKKDKKRYDDARQSSLDFLADPHNNIWTWSDKHVQLEAKPFTLDKVTQYITSALKKADTGGVSHADVLRAVFKAGLSIDDVTAALDVLGAEASVTDETNSGVADEILM